MGNVVHADPASELPAVLLCLEGVVVARGPRGERMIPADRCYRAPLTTALGPDELARHIADASALAVPSLWPEPFGIVGIEAFAACRPAVASATGRSCW